MIFNENDLQKFAENLAKHLQAGDILILTGELAAGKTTFTKGIARGLGVRQMVKSPTFTIVREYAGAALRLYHMDIYRVGDDPDSFDMYSYFEAGGVCVIEWGELLAEDLPESYLSVAFTKKGDDVREIKLTAHGKRAEEIIECLQK